MIMYGRPYRPQYPGYLRQTYRIGESVYSTAGSEAQKAPSVSTIGKMPHQWQKEHKREVSLSLAGQALGTADRTSVFKSSLQAAQNTAKANALSTRTIGNKAAETAALKAELEATATAVDAEMVVLAGCMKATLAAVESKQAPMDAVASWARLRATRPETEKLFDPVKHDLEVMHTTLSESVRLLDSALAAQRSELVRLKMKKDQLAADIADKSAGLGIDTAAEALPSRPSTAPAGGSSAIRMPVGAGYFGLRAPYDPVSWRSSSKAICDEAKKAVAVSGRVRDTSKQLIAKREYAELAVYTDLQKDEAASQSSIVQVRGDTEKQIAACEAEMASIDAQIAECEAGWAAKQEAIKVATERLTMRASRPARELVQDPAQRALAAELAECKHAARLIEGGVAKLQQDKLKLESIVGVLKDTVTLKSHFLSIEEAGESTMGALGNLYKSSAATMPKMTAFSIRLQNRPISALPANRVYAMRK